MTRYKWAQRGDLNAFFALMLDNVAVMIILVTALAGTKQFTPEFILTRMIPGTALGVLIGDIVYTYMAFRLAKATGRTDVTAMPLGLDTPSTFGVAFLVLLPARAYAGDADKGLGLAPEQAMEFAWHVGLVVLVMCGVIKTALSPFGNAVRKSLPRAGLLGSLAAIALTLIAFLPLLLDGIAAVPLVGMLALSVILYSLVAHRELPFKLPGALVAVALGVAVYWVATAVGKAAGVALVPPFGEGLPVLAWQPSSLADFYRSDSDWLSKVFTYSLGRLPVALPFALATIVGGIDCTESAAAAGDDYDTRTILLTEGIASLIAGLLGGVIQTTPYIGHPAFKKMGGRAAYTLANAFFIGLAGCLGVFSYLYTYLPTAAMFPILVFVGLEIGAQSFHATPVRHYPAVAFAMLPAFAYLILVPVNDITLSAGAFGFAWPDPLALSDAAKVPAAERMTLVMQTLRCLANGFLITGMIWAAMLAMLLDGRLKAAAGFCALAAVCAFFGVIHSPLGNEAINLPWNVMASIDAPFRRAVSHQTPYHWAATYALMAGLFLSLSATDKGPRLLDGEESATMHGA